MLDVSTVRMGSPSGTPVVAGVSAMVVHSVIVSLRTAGPDAEFRERAHLERLP